MKETNLGPFAIASIVAAAVGIPICLAALPSFVGPETFADAMPLRAPFRWEISRRGLGVHDGRAVMVADGYAVTRGGASPETSVYRVWLIDLATGAILGEHTSWDDLEPIDIRGGRLWARSSDDTYRALRVPDLAPEADLAEILAERAELPWDHVDTVHFPMDSENVRILASDGFLWDLQPDLTTLVKLHHDTPVPSSAEMPRPSFASLTGEIPLPSGRIAILGGGSKRPALRVADARGALETMEVNTPLDGFLDGTFLAVEWGRPIVRPPEDVFVQHHGEDGGSYRLSRVSAREGLRWTKGEAEWLPGGVEQGAGTEVAVAMDLGDTLFLWLERTPEDVWSGSDHFLIGLDPDTGDTRWLTAF